MGVTNRPESVGSDRELFGRFALDSNRFVADFEEDDDDDEIVGGDDEEED